MIDIDMKFYKKALNSTADLEACSSPTNFMKCQISKPELQLPQAPYDLFVYDVPYDLSDTVGGYDVCIYIV